MQYIKVLATDSTNTDLKRRLRAHREMGNTCLMAQQQTQARGQYGTKWESEPHKNLTVSILLKDLNLPASLAFKINALVSLAIIKFLQQKNDTGIYSIKWPNDILSGNQKICGILIENILYGKNISHSIIGIGLNVNQDRFHTLTHATSLKNITGQTHDLDKLMIELTERVETEVLSKLDDSLSSILSAYKKLLFRLHKTSLFSFPEGPQQKGIIQGVNNLGQLEVLFGNQLRNFNLKEIKLHY